MARSGAGLVVAGGVMGLAIACGGQTTSDSPGAGATSSAAARPELCELPLDGGNCFADMPSWGHDSETGLCVSFVYGGCGGNENRFETREACQATCRFGQPNFDSCNDNADCMLVSQMGCDQSCESLGERDLVAINPSHLNELRVLNGCPLVEQAACPFPSPLLVTDKFFYAVCVEGECTVRDTREQSLTECAVAGDCRLRCGTGCCASCGAGEDVIAVRADADLRAELCGDEEGACEACDCALPASVGVDCVAGRCEVTNLHACTPGDELSCNEEPWLLRSAGTCTELGQCICQPGRLEDSRSGRCY